MVMTLARAKKCPRCGVVKPLDNFNGNKSRRDEHSGYCRKCDYEIKRQLHLDDPDYMARYARSYRKHQQGTPQGRFRSLKDGARIRGQQCLISKGEFLIWFSNESKICHYCCRDINMVGVRTLDSLTIDRRNNELGYQLGNIVIACRRCNLIKGSWFSEEQMLEIARKYFKKEVTYGIPKAYA